MLLLAIVALVATMIPALEAVRVDPAQVLNEG
jgi:ABC-type lipoprotein release transport system permease subunit